MRKTIVLILVALLALPAMGAVTLASFSGNDFEGWVYTRDATVVELNRTNIVGKRIMLFNEGDNSYTLISPELNLSGVRKIELAATLHNDNTDDRNYKPAKTSPTFELITADDEVVATVTVAIAKEEFTYNIVTALDVPADAPGPLRLRLALWQADVHNALAVTKVTVTADDAPVPAQGDVNADGTVNGADVTVLYNVLLDNAVPAGNADVNDDGQVNGSDVTALYNLLLN